MKKLRLITILVLAVTLALGGMAAADDPSMVTYTGQGFSNGVLETEKCGLETDLGQDKDFVVGEDGAYLKWVLTAAGAESATITGPWGTFDMIQAAGGAFHKATDYYPVDALTGFPVTATWVGNVTGNVQLTVSNGCPGLVEKLTVTKTAVTSFIRTHDWDIAKSVETEKGYKLDNFPKIWLYVDGSGNEWAKWIVDVTYEGYEDSGFNVSGIITATNTGDLPAVVTSVSDVLGGTAIDVDCGVSFPYDLPVGNSLVCSYGTDVASKIEGMNVATVTTERDEYSGNASLTWGDPTSEIDKTVTVKDWRKPPEETKVLGTVTAPNGDTFTYTEDFAWADFGADDCGAHHIFNSAWLEGDSGQLGSAWANLKVNVQCIDYETAYAKGDDAVCFIPTFANWGWTNPITPGTYTWDLWAGAGQCDTSKGTLVGSVKVVYDAATGIVTVEFDLDEPYILDETHVYAGYGMFPLDRRGRPTVAPGLYTNEGPFGGSEIYVIAHAVVGIPDPDFGP